MSRLSYCIFDRETTTFSVTVLMLLCDLLAWCFKIEIVNTELLFVLMTSRTSNTSFLDHLNLWCLINREHRMIQQMRPWKRVYSYNMWCYWICRFRAMRLQKFFDVLNKVYRLCLFSGVVKSDLRAHNCERKKDSK